MIWFAIAFNLFAFVLSANSWAGGSSVAAFCAGINISMVAALMFVKALE
jgi:hypothetical protein